MSMFNDVIKKNYKLIMVYLILGISIVFCETYSIRVFQEILDLIPQNNVSLVKIIVYALFLLLGHVLNYLDNYPKTKLSTKIFLDFKIGAIKKMRTICYKEYQKMGTGQLLQIIENGSNAGKYIWIDFRFRVIRELIPSLLFSLLFIAQIDLKIMFVILGGYVAVFIITNILLKFLYAIKKNVLVNEEGLNRKLTRGFMELTIFRIYRRFNKEIKECVDMQENIVKGKSKLVMLHEAFFVLFAILIGFVKILIVCAQLMNWNLSVGEIVAMLMLVDKAYTPIAIFNVIYVEKKLEQVAYERYLKVLRLPDDEALEKKSVEKINKFDIELDKVSFYYDEKKIIDNLSMHIPEGASVALVGESGSGKSTIVKIVLGLLKYTSGTIKIGQRELPDLNLSNYYENVSYISQETPVFDGTIRENIVFDNDVEEEQIMKVLDMVSLKDFVLSLERGLDTPVGERGKLLSGGERQRLALARAFFDDSKLVILDEATSAIDNITECVIVKNLLKCFKNKTVIIIAHRLNSIEDVDKIYAIKNSQIVAEGSFNELLKSSEYFQKLWKTSIEQN